MQRPAGTASAERYGRDPERYLSSGVLAHIASMPSSQLGHFGESEVEKSSRVSGTRETCGRHYFAGKRTGTSHMLDPLGTCTSLTNSDLSFM